MARTRSLDFDLHRNTILEKAAALFAQKGYSSSSMNDLATACSISKPLLYHYFRDKADILAAICDSHVSRLAAIAAEVESMQLDATAHLRRLIERFVQEYTGAQNAHRVLTEDVKFLSKPAARKILEKERQVVDAYARAIQRIRPEVGRQALEKPLTMLLFGMINWMFTWFDPKGGVSAERMGQIVSDLFLGGLYEVSLSKEKVLPLKKRA
jgi:TetR/AcrR family transcriptional regulator